MNWIIRYSDKIKAHTYLDDVLKPILDDIKDLNWLISDLEYGSCQVHEPPLNYEQDHFILSSEQFDKLIEAKVQIYWAVVLGIPQDIQIIVDEDVLPYAEGNGLIWKNGNIQHPDALIEIVCVDSGYTIVKFKDKELSNKFKAYFDEAIELEKFSDTWLK